MYNNFETKGQMSNSVGDAGCGSHLRKDDCGKVKLTTGKSRNTCPINLVHCLCWKTTLAVNSGRY
jgi:hypothetical protein